MLGALASIFFGTATERPPSVPKRVHYVTFRVDDENVAKAMRNWYSEREEARAEVEKFVSDYFCMSVLRIDKPIYKLDDDGRLHSVLFNGFVPPGWKGIPGSHWLEPVTPDMAKQVDALPRMSPYKDLHNLINWPSFETKWFNEQDREKVQRINQMVRPYGDGEHTYVDVPHPDNFRDFPRIYEQVKKWKPPAFLVNPDKEAGPKNDTMNREI